MTLCDICDISMIITIQVASRKNLRTIMCYNNIIAPSSLLALSQSGCNQLPGSKHFHFFTAILLCFGLQTTRAAVDNILCVRDWSR